MILEALSVYSLWFYANYIWVSSCLSICLAFCLSVCLSLCLTVRPSIESHNIDLVRLTACVLFASFGVNLCDIVMTIICCAADFHLKLYARALPGISVQIAPRTHIHVYKYINIHIRTHTETSLCERWGKVADVNKCQAQREKHWERSNKSNVWHPITAWNQKEISSGNMCVWWGKNPGNTTISQWRQQQRKRVLPVKKISWI